MTIEKNMNFQYFILLVLQNLHFLVNLIHAEDSPSLPRGNQIPKFNLD